MNQFWKDIKDVCRTLSCTEQLRLNAGASRIEIARLEAHLGVVLPMDLKDMLHQHDGQADGPGLIYGQEFLSIAKIRASCDAWRRVTGMNDDFASAMSSSPPGVVKAMYANPKWIPISHDYGGNHFGIDYDPDHKGMVGQIISFGRDEDQKQFKASSFTAFMNELVCQLGQTKWNGIYREWVGRA